MPQMEQLQHIGEMDPQLQQLVTNLVTEHWAFNQIICFTEYTTGKERSRRNLCAFKKLAPDSAAFCLSTSAWAELMVGLSSMKALFWALDLEILTICSCTQPLLSSSECLPCCKNLPHCKGSEGPACMQLTPALVWNGSVYGLAYALSTQGLLVIQTCNPNLMKNEALFPLNA